MRKIVFTRPKKIVYADQIAQQRKRMGVLLSPPKPNKPPMLDDIVSNLRERSRHSPRAERDLVRWLAECGVAPMALTLDGAFKEMWTAPRDKLIAVAAALRG